MKRSQYIYYVVLFIFVGATYWQVSLLQHPLLWDATDAEFPWRYFISECLRNGHLPAWNPYQLCGYPFFADPQSGAWYPIALITGLLTRYSVYVFQLEFVLTIFIGGAGMFRLLKTLSLTSDTALFGAICFSACGIFVGNAEHFSWVVSAAWMVWLLWAYHSMLQTLKYGYALLCAIFLSLMFTGGYIAFIIVAGYIMLGFFIAGLTSEKDNSRRFILVKNHALFAALFLLLTGACIFYYAEALHYITRGNGITLKKANGIPFTPRSALSFILPFTTIKNEPFFQTDISMRNAYFSITGLALMITGLIMPKNRKKWAIIIISFLSLLVSFGPALPLRKWLYDYVPLMNLFRFPSLFRLFFIIGFIILAAGTLQQITETPARYLSRLRLVVIGLILLLAALMGYELHKYGLAGNYNLLFSNISKFIEQSVFYQHIIVQSIVQIVLLLLLLFMIQFRNARFFTAKYVLLLCVIDLFAATQLNAYGTIVSTESSRKIYEKVREQPQGFPVPDDQVSMAANSAYANNAHMWPVWGNVNTFKKNVGAGGYDPFTLSNFEALDESHIKDSIWANSYLYLSYSAVPLDKNAVLSNHKVAVVEQAVFDSISGMDLKSGANDKIEVLSFEPCKVTATTSTEHAAVLILQQASYPGWKVFVDDKPVQYFTTAYANISLVVQPGKHSVIFAFEPQHLLLFAAVSIGSFICIILCLLLFRKKLF